MVQIKVCTAWDWRYTNALLCRIEDAFKDAGVKWGGNIALVPNAYELRRGLAVNSYIDRFGDRGVLRRRSIDVYLEFENPDDALIFDLGFPALIED